MFQGKSVRFKNGSLKIKGELDVIDDPNEEIEIFPEKEDKSEVKEKKSREKTTKKKNGDESSDDEDEDSGYINPDDDDDDQHKIFSIQPKEDFHNSNYVRKITFVPPEERETSEIMTEEERSEVIGRRMKQLKESRAFIDTTNLFSDEEIAIQEIKQRRCPLAIVRMIEKNKTAEWWAVNEMSLPY